MAHSYAKRGADGVVVKGSVFLVVCVLAVAPLCLSASVVFVVSVFLYRGTVFDPLYGESGATGPSVGPTIN